MACSQPATANNRPFFHRVESLRGLGAVAIAAYHISGAALHGVIFWNHSAWNEIRTTQDVLSWLGFALTPAHAALMLFFVISGFVLRISLEYGPQKVSTAAAKFTLGRLFRIFPIVFFAVIVSAILYGGVIHTHDGAARPLTAATLFANLFLLDASMNSTLWALQVEMIMAPVILVLYFLERRGGPRLLLAVALGTTVLAFWSTWAVWPPLSTNVFPFVLGMLVPTIGRRFAVNQSRRAATWWTAAMIAVLLCTDHWCGFYTRHSAVIEAYAATVLISLVAYRPDISALKFLDAWPLRRIGLASGSYYVLHMLTVAPFLALANVVVPAAWATAYPAAVGLVVVPTWLVVMALPAYVCFQCIEAPGVALGRRVIRSGFPGQSAHPPRVVEAPQRPYSSDLRTRRAS